MTTEGAPLCLLRLPAVMARVGLKRTAIYDLVKRGAFPHPIKLGRRCTVFPSDAIDSWIAAKVAAARAARGGT